MTQTVFDEVVRITEDYLGPAAKRFVARQISSHLGKEPTEIRLEDIPQLSEWTRATLALLTRDRRLIDEYTEKLQQLAIDINRPISGDPQNFQVQ